MDLSNARFVLTTILFGSIAATTGAPRAQAGPPSPAASRPGTQKFARKTTDPPIAARGKLSHELFVAVDHRDVTAVRALLQRGADPNSRNGLEMTPLYIAAASHQPEAMQALLHAGAKVDTSSPYGTPLTFAAMGGNVPGAQLLLARGADPNAWRVDGITPLMLAARAGAPDLVTALLRRKAGLNATDNDGASPLIYAAREGNVDAARILLDAGAKIEGADGHRKTPLMYAAANGRAELVRLLLERGAKPDLHDAKGRTALLLAASYGDYPEVVRALLDGGADATVADARGRTATTIATARGYTQSAALLAERVPAVTTGQTPAAGIAVRAGLRQIEASTRAFTQRTSCLSCHHEGLGRMATAALGARGYRLDPAVQKAQAARVNGAMTALRPLNQSALTDPEAMKRVPLIEIQEVTTGDAWLLAGMAAQNQPATEGAGAMAMVLARQQMPDGHWHFSLPRVPMQSSVFTFTALAVRALRAYAPKAYAAEAKERIQRAKGWLLTAKPQTSEDRAFRLLGLHWSGATAEEKRAATDELTADQRPDGGWSQTPDLQSDAYAAGQALYALHIAGGVPVTEAAYTRGVAFLLRTQDEDGSWFVNKRALPVNNYFDTGFPHGESQYASFNGTCWATMALAQTINQVQAASTR